MNVWGYTMSVMRCFLAIELSDAVRSRLAALQDRLRERTRGVRWARAEQIHLTMKFLGDVRDGDVPAVTEAARQIAEQFEPFELTIAGTGCFPPHGAARIVWAGLANPPETLLACYRAGEEAFAELGFKPEDRPFKPHLTLGRVKPGRTAYDVRSVVDAEVEFVAGGFLVEQMTLFQSILDHSGASYVTLATLPLGSAGP